MTEPLPRPEDPWAGRASVLVTIDFRGFLSTDAEVLIDGRLAKLRRADQVLYLIHPFTFAAWLRGDEIEGLALPQASER